MGCKLFIKCNKVFVLPEPDGPIINILNGQLLRSKELDPVVSLFSFLLLTILSILSFYIFFNIFDLIIPTDSFNYYTILPLYPYR